MPWWIDLMYIFGREGGAISYQLMLGYPSASTDCMRASHRSWLALMPVVLLPHAAAGFLTLQSDVCHADGVYGLDVGGEEMSHAGPWEDTLCRLICSSWQLLEIKRSNLRSGIPGIQDKHGGAPGYSLHPSDPRRPESVGNEVFHHFLVSFNYLISEQKSKFWSFWLFTFMLKN